MFTFLKKIDWVMTLFLLPVVLAGLFTMKSFGFGESSVDYFGKQIIWVALSFFVFFIFSSIDFRFLKRTDVLVFLFSFVCLILLAIFLVGKVSKGARSWLDFGLFSFQPVDFMKLVLVLILSKYFSRRHVEIRNIKHIFISGIYAFVPFILVFLQPDFGSAMILFFIWIGMVFVSGISKTHLVVIVLTGIMIFMSLWFFVFKDYQKNRIMDFLNPLANIQTSGYNVFQSTIAVGSGQVFGKGLGFGSQSRLNFLPEAQTDFIFASFAEEWGFVGSIILILLFCLIVGRVLYFASLGASNFEILFGMGIAIFFMSHIVINIGMNLGIFPVTGIPLPFMSYGGSHLLTEFMSLGILVSMSKYSRGVHKDDIKNEFLGV